MYLLFRGVEFYPCGGWEDFVGVYKYLSDAKAAGEKNLPPYGWWHVAELADTELYSDAALGIVAEGRGGTHGR